MIKKFNTYNESVRDNMTPKSKDDIVSTFNSGDIQSKKNMVYKLFRENFKNRAEFSNYIRLHMGVDIWNRVIKKTLRNGFASDLVDVLKKHEIEKLFKVMIEKGKGLNESIKDMMTPKSEKDIRNMMDRLALNPNEKLYFGVENNIDWVVKESIEEGSDVNMKLRVGGGVMGELFNSLLQFACYKGYTDIVKMLLDAGANKELDDNLAMRAAVAHGHDDIIKLLKITKNINESIKDLMTPKSDEDIRKSISELSEKDIFDRYIKAIIEKNFGVLDALKKAGCSINSRNSDKQTPLIDLLCNNHIHSREAIRAIVKKLGADINLKDRNDRTALMYAVDNNKFSFVQELIELGVNLKLHNQGARALLRAISNNVNYVIVESLVKAGADVNYIDNNHSTALIYATLQSNRQVTELLLSKGVDVNIKNEYGMSPLMMAAKGEDQEIIKMLLDAGADSDDKNNNYQTAADFALAYKKKENAELIKNYKKVNEGIRDKMTPKSEEELRDKINDMSPDEALLLGLDNDIPWVVRDAINRGADMYKEIGKSTNPWRNAKSPLIHAINGEKIEIIKVLLECGYDLSRENDFEVRTLYILTIKKNDEELQDIVANYLNLKESVRDKMTPKPKEEILKSFDHMTPVELFRKGEWEGYDELMLSAVEKGYDLELNNKEGIRTIIRQNHTKILEYLLKKGYKLTTENGFDPFYIAALNGHNKMIRLMIKYNVKMVSPNPIIAAKIIHHDETSRLLADYYKKTHSIQESLRDKMTPKSKEDIEANLEDMEPFERMTTIFNQHTDDMYMGIKSYYNQEEIDNLIPGYIEITNDIFDTHEKIDHLYYYYNLSVLIRQELKSDLVTLPASEQIQYCHDMEYLGGLYTNQEWDELGKRALEEKQKKLVNEGLRDKMTPKSDEDIKKAAENLSPEELLDLGCKYGYVWAVNKAIKQGSRVAGGRDKPLRTACAFGHFDVVKILLDNDADIHADSEFPIRSAAFIGNKEIVDYLISKGANLKRAMEYYAVTPQDRQVDEFLEEYSKNLLIDIHKNQLKDMMGESIRDKMTPKPEEEVNKSLEPLLKNIAAYVWKLEKNGMGTIGVKNFAEACDFVKSEMDWIWKLIDDYRTVDPYKIAVRICHEKRTRK